MKIKKFLLYITCGSLSACGIILYYTLISLVSIKTYTIDIDPSFSSIIHTNINDYIQNTPSFKTASLCTINDHIKNKFPCIQEITSELYAPCTAHIQIKATKPLISVNNTMVLTSDGTYISKELFTTNTINATVPIQCSDPSIPISSALFQSCHRFLNPLFQQYTIIWHNDHTTFLHSKKEPWFTIICNAESIPNDTILMHCEHLKQKIATQNTKKTSTNWKADIRFHNQIVIYNEKKGATYGCAIV